MKIRDLLRPILVVALLPAAIGAGYMARDVPAGVWELMRTRTTAHAEMPPRPAPAVQLEPVRPELVIQAPQPERVAWATATDPARPETTPRRSSRQSGIWRVVCEEIRHEATDAVQMQVCRLMQMFREGGADVRLTVGSTADGSVLALDLPGDVSRIDGVSVGVGPLGAALDRLACDGEGCQAALPFSDALASYALREGSIDIGYRRQGRDVRLRLPMDGFQEALALVAPEPPAPAVQAPPAPPAESRRSGSGRRR